MDIAKTYGMRNDMELEGFKRLYGFDPPPAYFRVVDTEPGRQGIIVKRVLQREAFWKMRDEMEALIEQRATDGGLLLGRLDIAEGFRV